MPTGVISLKLGRPLGMTIKRLEAFLETARCDASKARNAAVVHWYIWRRQHTDWTPGDVYEAPAAKIMRKPKARQDGKCPKDSPLGPRLFLSRELYAVAREASPNLSASLASSCVQDVISRLKANTPYNHDGEARWQWQAILSHEVSLPSWRFGAVPCPNNVCRLVYNDHACTLHFPLLSKQSGYRQMSPTVRLHVGDMSVGHRRLLRKIADGELKMKDSTLVQAKGKWFLRLVYDVPAKGLGLSPDRVLWILPDLPEGKRPFVLSYPNGETGRKTWGIGNGLPLVAEYRRVVARRRAIRYRYSDGCGKGHGRQRWYKSIRPIARAVRDMQQRFEKQTIADIIAFAIRDGCGAILYREPTMPVRERSWFAKRDVPFAWTEFEARLRFKTETSGLAYNGRPRIGMQEWKGEKRQKDAG